MRGRSRLWLGIGALVLAVLSGLGFWRFWPERRLSEAEFAAAYSEALPPLAPRSPVYHIGHSLVGRTMPELLAAFGGHLFHSQLGWGASLDSHWREDVPGFAESNDPPFFRPAGEALDSGDYPVVVLTEMVELKDAIRWHDSARALGDWAIRARAGRADVRLYLYETWHQLDDPAGWEARVDADLPELWEGRLLRVAMARPGVGVIHVIPAGKAMAEAARAAEAGQVPGVAGLRDFFEDNIHYSDLGAYVVALTHYATIYGITPVGLPHELWLFEGRHAGAPSPEAAKALQEVVWKVVTGYPPTGVASVR